MPQSLKKRAAELEHLVRERAEIVKRVLKEYRETERASASKAKGTLHTRDRERLNRKRLDVERANAEYMQLQKELDRVRHRLQAGKS
ncbi:MAG TPA: hypothetical protein VNN73_04360 [Blastocatellia bacterium]|nr:hypothetical protein [Blastocatellia bacterium]